METGLLRLEISNELNSILKYWKEHTVDHKNGGFYGLVDIDNIPDPHADKGIILNTRILWTFSAAYGFTGEKAYLDLADRAYDYLESFFFDRHYGGVWWKVDFRGRPADRRKQIYAQAFAIYALSEYFKVKKDHAIIDQATGMFHLIEKHSYDKERDGYIEAFDEKWDFLEDVRLGENDQNEKKTMNTHLHLLEAYTNLYRIRKDELIHDRLAGLINLFIHQIIDKETYHLNLFFNEEWKLRSSKISFGHDIEAAWLLCEAAESLRDRNLIKDISDISLKITRAAARGLDDDGGLMNEYDMSDNHLDGDKHWWPQAEALVGFLNGYQLSGDAYFYERFLDSWEFINKFIIDHKKGEWFWLADRARKPSMKEKAGFWKCPYHNTRACMEIISRLEKIENDKDQG
ncbi:MAG: AGE family epimerase/isomerase [Bacteroidales bacterium]|nr:AGE family epimerase/isomerase [Bacteroidales bacterium]